MRLTDADDYFYGGVGGVQVQGLGGDDLFELVSDDADVDFLSGGDGSDTYQLNGTSARLLPTW